MILARALDPSLDVCCLPSPYKIPQYVAGMAFNFSKIEIAHHVSQRKSPLQVKQPPATQTGSRVTIHQQRRSPVF